MISSKKQTHNLKNLERMRLEINKRIEQHLVDIIRILDENSEDTDENEEFPGQLLSTETILKGSVIATEDIDEQIKAKYLTRLVREYRRNRERAK